MSTGLVAVLALVLALVLPRSGNSARAFSAVLSSLRDHDSVSFAQRFVSERDSSDRMQYWSVQGPWTRTECATLRQTWNEETREFLELDLAAKEAHRTTLSRESLLDSPFLDPIDQLRGLADDQGIFVGSEVLEGFDCDLYHVSSPNLLGTFGTPPDPMRVWVDRETGLPIRIRLQTSFEIPEVAEQDFIEWTEFDWQPTFEDGWFSLDTPEGFTDRKEG